MALLLGALALGTTTVTLPAHAQSDAALAEAKQRFDEGLKLADDGNHEAARLKFSQAYAVFKSPSVLYNLARSEQLTGHDLEALEHFREFVKMGADPKITDTQRAKARENIAELEKKVGQIDIEAPAGAQVKVDGKVLPEVPREPLPIAPGRHTVEATFEGKIKSVTVECVAGNKTKATITFDDGFTEPPPGGGGDSSSTRYIVPGIIGALGLAGLGLGVGFAISSQTAKEQEDRIRDAGAGICGANGDPPRCDELREVRGDVNSRATLSTIGYIAGGTLVLAAVVTYFVWPKAKSSTATRFNFSPVAGGGTVHFGTNF